MHSCIHSADTQREAPQLPAGIHAGWPGPRLGPLSYADLSHIPSTTSVC